MHLLTLLSQFTDRNDRVPTPFIYIKPEKASLSGGAYPHSHYREDPPGLLKYLGFPDQTKTKFKFSLHDLRCTTLVINFSPFSLVCVRQVVTYVLVFLKLLLFVISTLTRQQVKATALNHVNEGISV